MFTPRLPRATGWALLAAVAAAAALLAIVRKQAAESLRHPLAAATAAVCGLLMARLPEPTFFLLVPLLAAAIAWPFGPPPAERPLPRGTVTAVFALGAGAFLFQSLRRHWSFASGGLDLGVFYQTQWLMNRGMPLENTVLGMHALADHMLFGEMLLARLLALYDGAETLLVLQSVGVASAVFPLYDMGRRLLGRPRGALALPLAWLLSPDVHSGVLFDYNPTCLGAAALVWTAWALACRGPAAVVVAVLVTCAIKENLCLYVAVMALVVLATRLVSWRRAAAVASFALSFFVLEMAVLFPWFAERGFRHWDFDDFGQRPAEIFTAIASQPAHAGMLAVGEERKRRSLLQPLTGTGYLMTVEPVALLMQLPNWGERLLSSHRTRWWGYYYGMPAAATALVGLLMGWLRLQRAGRAGPRLPAYVVACAALVGLVPPYATHDGDRHSMVYTWRRPYASPAADAATQRAAVGFIGHDARLKVAAQHHLIPHLAGRPFIVGLQRAGEADRVALQLNAETWPESRRAWRQHLRDLWATGRFHVGFCRANTVVLVRGAGPDAPCPSWRGLLSLPESS